MKRLSVLMFVLMLGVAPTFAEDGGVSVSDVADHSEETSEATTYDQSKRAVIDQEQLQKQLLDQINACTVQRPSN